ncbi:MAG: hypothetical protein ACSHX0_11025 [Akkermansiaceae bacterium]
MNKQYIRYSIALALVACFSSCATPARVSEMSVVAPSAIKNAKYKNAIAVVEVKGGKETNPAWTSQISSSDFKEALNNSLASAGLLAQKQNVKYDLSVNMLSVKQPAIGISFTVYTQVQYSLTKRSNKQQVVNEVIDANYTAKMSDSIVGVKRLKLANEGAAKENIKAFLNKL